VPTTKTPNHELSEMKCPVSLADVDLFSPGAQEHWYEAYTILHNEAPVHRIPGEGTSPDTDGFILTKYEDLARIVRDPKRFPPPSFSMPPPKEPKEKTKTKEIEFTPQMNAMMISIASLRPNMELWKQHRQQLTDPWVGPGAGRNEKMITEAVDSLIDNWIDKGTVEFIHEFAAPLPQIVMTNVLGFPLKDMPKLRDWGSAQVKRFVFGTGHRNLLTPEEEIEQVKVLSEFADYVQQVVADKRNNPADDMITFLTQETYEPLDRKLTDIEIIGIVYAMHLGGLETTQYALEEEAQLLCETPRLFDEIKADREKVRAFAEESLRVRAPTQGLSTRMTTQDETFQGVKVPAGSILHMRYGAGNIDPDEYECPRDIQLDRKGITRHLTFSQGPRTCPGSGISRLEQVIAWNRLLDRLDSLEYAPGNTFMHQPGIMLGTLELNLNFKKAK
jgi:cytochrome P450